MRAAAPNPYATERTMRNGTLGAGSSDVCLDRSWASKLGTHIADHCVRRSQFRRRSGSGRRSMS